MSLRNGYCKSTDYMHNKCTIIRYFTLNFVTVNIMPLRILGYCKPTLQYVIQLIENVNFKDMSL